MVRYKVDDYFKAVFMSPFNQFFELLHSLLRIISKICVDIIIVTYGIGRSCLTFYELWMRWDTALLGLLCRVPDNACIPYMAASEPFQVI